MRWYFETIGDTVQLDARAEGDDGTIGDARAEVLPGEDFHGISYDELVAADAGIVEVDDNGVGTIVSGDEDDDDAGVP